MPSLLASGMKQVYEPIAGPMSFATEEVRFFSVPRYLTCWPLGAPRKVVVDGELIGIPAPPVAFEDHRFVTNENAIVTAMIANHQFGHTRYGYTLDPSCIPAPFRENWPTYSLKTKRKIGIALAAGTDPKEVLASLQPDELKAEAATAPLPQEAPLRYICPVPGCGVEVSETNAKKAQDGILEHVKLMHAGWKA